MKTQDIITDRLELREITEDDTELIVMWRSNYNIYKYFGSPHAITSSEHLEWYHNYIQDNSIVHFIAIEKVTRDAIGVFGVKRCKENKECAEISSCILDEGKREKGYAQEATNAMVEYATKIWKVKRVVADVHKENEASKKMFNRCGFYLSGESDVFYIFVRDICYT